MIQTSEAFKQAVLDNKPQRCLFLFSDSFFTNEDVLLTNGGVHFVEPFVLEKDLAIGQCPSARLTFTLNNEQGLLENYEFGDFYASIGVQIEKAVHSTQYIVEAILTPSERLTVRADGLYLNDTRCTAQPANIPDCLVVDGNTVYAWQNGIHGWKAAIADGDLTDGQEIETNPFMQNKMRGFVGRGIVKRGNIITECAYGYCTVWEYAPLGLFVANRPNVTRKKTINVQCSDKMTLFDFEMSEIKIHYPITHRKLAEELCSHVGVVMDDADFINQDKSVSKAPDDFKSATGRDVLGWIAEAACSNARMSREGTLVFDWFHSTDMVVAENMRTSYEQYWYETLPVDKLVVRNYDSNRELQLGDGENGLLIENNPMMRQDDKLTGKSVGSAKTDGDQIYERLSQTGTYHPGSTRTFVDWSVQAGDIISVNDDNVNYPLPVYTLDVQWSGTPITTMSATGEQKRKRIKNREQRQSFSTNAANYQQAQQAKEAVDELADEYHTGSEITDKYIKLFATSITGKELGPDGTITGEIDQALVQIQANQYLSYVASNDIKSVFTQTYEGFELQGEKIVLKGITYLTDAQGEYIYADRMVADDFSTRDLQAASLTVGSRTDVEDRDESNIYGWLNVHGLLSIPVYGNDGNEDTISLNYHAHKITATDDGTVTIGEPTEDPQSANFNIANTNFHKDGVRKALNDGALSVTMTGGKWGDAKYTVTASSEYADDRTFDVPQMPVALTISKFSSEHKATATLTTNSTSGGPFLLNTQLIDASGVWQDGYDTGKSSGGSVSPSDISADEFIFYPDGNSIPSSYTQLNNLSNVIRDNKSSRGYATFSISVKGAKKYYRIPIGGQGW